MDPRLVNSGNGVAAGAADEFDVRKFATEHRIHVQHGSLFADRYLLIHPAELAPENEATLRAKMHKVYSLNAPSFFSSQPQGPIAQHLGELLAVSPQSREASIRRQINDLHQQQQTGIDPALKRASEKEGGPFSALVQELKSDNARDPVKNEQYANGMTMYLVLNEALRQRGYREDLSKYIRHKSRAENVLADLERMLGVSPTVIMETARSKGLQGVGGLLGVDAKYVQEAGQLAEYTSHHKFSENMIENWKMGRKQPGMEHAGVREKIEAGLEPRIAHKINQMRAQVQFNYQVPDGIRDTENMVVGALGLLPRVLVENLYELGTEFAYTPEITVDPIAPGSHAYGFHRKLTNHPGDVDGVYQIFLSGKEDAESFTRLIAHESHHLLFANRFSPEETKQIDTLMRGDVVRLTQLKRLMDSWIRGDKQEKQQIEKIINEHFSLGGTSLDGIRQQGVDMLTVYNMVEHAYDRLNIYSNFFTKGGYSSPEDKVYEVNSRYAELRYVRLREQPELLNFLVPGLTQVYDNFYLPHLEQQLGELKARHNATPQVTQSTVASVGNAGTTPLRTAATMPSTQPPAGPVTARPAAPGAGHRRGVNRGTPSTTIAAATIEHAPMQDNQIQI